MPLLHRFSCNVSDFLHFQTGFVDLELVMVKRCACGTYNSDNRYSARLEGDKKTCGANMINST